MDFEHKMGTGQTVAIVISCMIGAGVVIFWIVLIVYCCIKRKNIHNQSTFSRPTPVVVSSSTHSAAAYQTNVYAAPYPPQGAHTVIPMADDRRSPPGLQLYAAPYQSTSSSSAAQMDPPSYQNAVNEFGSKDQLNASTYEKQAL